MEENKKEKIIVKNVGQRGEGIEGPKKGQQRHRRKEYLWGGKSTSGTGGVQAVGKV